MNDLNDTDFRALQLDLAARESTRTCDRCEVVPFASALGRYDIRSPQWFVCTNEPAYARQCDDCKARTFGWIADVPFEKFKAHVQANASNIWSIEELRQYLPPGPVACVPQCGAPAAPPAGPKGGFEFL